MKKLLLTIAILFGSVTAVQAQDTLLINGLNDLVYKTGQTTYSNSNGPVALAWLKFVSTKDFNDWSYSLVQVHCSTGMYRIIQGTQYYGTRSVGTFSADWNTQWSNPTPGSISSDLYRLCR